VRFVYLANVRPAVARAHHRLVVYAARQMFANRVNALAPADRQHVQHRLQQVRVRRAVWTSRARFRSDVIDRYGVRPPLAFDGGGGGFCSHVFTRQVFSCWARERFFVSVRTTRVVLTTLDTRTSRPSTGNFASNRLDGCRAITYFANDDHCVWTSFNTFIGGVFWMSFFWKLFG